MKQDYKHHIRWYIPHHFIFYPLVFASAVISACCIFRYPEQALAWTAISGAFLAVAWLSYMMRQHYALNNQNRIVRLEMRFRYYVLTQQRFELLETKLSFGQIAALRFASDEELPALVSKAIQEGLSPDMIKQSIKNWLPDEMRV